MIRSLRLSVDLEEQTALHLWITFAVSVSFSQVIIPKASDNVLPCGAALTLTW